MGSCLAQGNAHNVCNINIKDTFLLILRGAEEVSKGIDEIMEKVDKSKAYLDQIEDDVKLTIKSSLKWALNSQNQSGGTVDASTNNQED